MHEEQTAPASAPAWAFRTDHVQESAYWTEVFTPDECEVIKLAANTFNLYKAQVSGDEQYQKIRDSKVVFINPTSTHNWIYRRLTDRIMSLNEQFFKFDLWGFSEPLQYTEYTSPGGKYGSHVDSSYGGVIRKLSIVVQLTDPETYTGGEFELLPSGEQFPKKLNNMQGSLLAFPSYTLHRVTPMVTGIRNSLVGWISGPSFK
jgi:PKHD-type hydroxylase